jgi:hypothetical protein
VPFVIIPFRQVTLGTRAPIEDLLVAQRSVSVWPTCLRDKCKWTQWRNAGSHNAGFVMVNIILPCMPRFLKRSLPYISLYPTKIVYAFLVSPPCATCLIHTIEHALNSLIMFSAECSYKADPYTFVHRPSLLPLTDAAGVAQSV